MPANIDRFKTLLRDTISKHYARVNEYLEGGYGYSVYTEDGLSSIGGVCNCETGIPVPQSDDMYSYYHHGAVEWQHFDDHGLFDEVNARLRKRRDKPAWKRE